MVLCNRVIAIDFYEFLGVLMQTKTVRAISDMVDVSPSTVWRIVNRKVSPTLETCDKILKAFECELQVRKTGDK